MELFRDDGHLTDEALRALTRGDELSESDRLEISEHLGYCNDCLEHYAAQMTDETLLSPEHGCRPRLKRRVLLRTARLMAGRYAAAAAALMIIMTALWGSLGLPAMQQPHAKAAPPVTVVYQERISRAKHHSEHRNAVNKKTFTGFDKIWGLLEANTPAKIKGGYRR